MKRNLLMAAAAAAMCIGALGALAHEGATGVVKERMELMKVIGDTMKSLTDMMRGKKDYDASEVRAAARKMADHGSEALTRLFPEDSLHGPTEALPEIWSDWERFSSLADQLTEYAKALEAAAGNERMPAGSGMMMGNGQPTMGGTGMMGGNGMMGSNGMMGGNMMMGDSQAMSPEALAAMPPNAAFMHLADTCSSCHQDFRKEKK